MKKYLKLAGFVLGCAVSAMASAQPGVTAISFTGTAMSGTGSWPIVASPAFWNIGAILLDSAHNPIGFLSPLTTLNTASAASYHTGFRVTLGAAAPAGAIVVVYRSTKSFVAGDPVDKAEYPGLCPTGCVAGDLIVPVTGELLNTDFTAGASAMPVTLRDFSVE
jgi:hypothetical protein